MALGEDRGDPAQTIAQRLARDLDQVLAACRDHLLDVREPGVDQAAGDDESLALYHQVFLVRAEAQVQVPS